MNKLHITSIILCVASIFACKKESTNWESDWTVPVMHGHLTINDMLPAENVETNEAGYLSLIIHRPVFEFSLDTLIKLPDTTISEKTAIEGDDFAVSPTFFLPNTFDQIYDLGEIQLKRVIIESGEAITTARSEWPGKTKVVVNFPKAVNPDGILENTFLLEAGSSMAPSSSDAIIPMNDYDMDLTGNDGLQYNAVNINVLVFSDEESETFTVTDQDSVSMSFGFNNMVPKYAKGYFGQYYFSDTMGIALPQLKKVVAGSIDLDSIRLNLTIKNGFNLIAQSKISKLTGINTITSSLTELDFPNKNIDLNINPASGGLYDYVPSEYALDINNSNSNILSFIENLSDSIIIGYGLKINPFGNTTAGSDEFFPDSKMELFLDGEFPLSFGANNLTIVDTLTISVPEQKNIAVKNGKITLDYTNGFPIGAVSKFYMLDENEVIIDSLITTTGIQPGTYQVDTYETTPHISAITYALTPSQVENISNSKQLILNVAFTTEGTENIKITPETFFDFNLHSNLKISITY